MGRPAARVGDQVACPGATPGTPPVPHVGGPILPPCAVTVITCGSPQARITDMSFCVGPPAQIVTGAFNVLVCGKPAARIADMTNHGGRIVTGAPTVLIGTNGSAQAAMGAGAVALSPECVKLADAMDMARLSDHVYSKGADAEGEAPPLDFGYREATSDELQALGLGANDLAPENSEFRANVYVQDQADGSKEYVVAMKGTTSGSDWYQNGLNGVGLKSDYYERAVSIGRTVRAQRMGDSVRFTGHSLGGGLASAASIASGSEATTFNAAGFAPGPASPVADYQANPDNVDAYYVEGEVLNSAQDNRGSVIGTLLGGLALVNTPAAAGLGLFLANQKRKGETIMPHAFGERHRLESVAPDGKEDKGIRSTVDKHLMDWVMSSLEAEQRSNGCLE